MAHLLKVGMVGSKNEPTIKIDIKSSYAQYHRFYEEGKFDFFMVVTKLVGSAIEPALPAGPQIMDIYVHMGSMNLGS